MNAYYNDIAALYVMKDGPYFDLPGVDPWDEARDARMYDGPYPVVAHPPCQRWGRLYAGSPSHIAKTGVKKKLGDDGGCFAAAVAAVRHYGGVLEHPEGSKAFEEFGLARPHRSGGWIPADLHGGYVCRVEQGYYGHYCPKPTWLYAVGTDLPELRWGIHKVTDDDFRRVAPHHVKKHGIDRCRRMGLMSMKGGGRDSRIRNHTPAEFRDILITMARSSTP